MQYLENSNGLVDALSYIDEHIPYRKDDFYAALKQDQAEINRDWAHWLPELNLPDKYSVNIYAGGYGIFSVPALVEHGAGRVSMYDYDQEVADVNWRLLSAYRAKVLLNQTVADVVFDLDWINTDVDLVVNTSCECMVNFKGIKAKHKPGTVFILLGTNKAQKGAINVPKSLDEFVLGTGITDIQYAGVLPNDKYMVIGI